MRFYDRFLMLCKEKGVSPSRAAIEMGMNKGTISVWKSKDKLGEDVEPSTPNINKMSAYFGVSTDYLLGNVREPFFHLDSDRILKDINSYDDASTIKKAPTLTNKDERDIARDLEAIMADLDKGGALMFDGDPMTDEAKESIKAAMKLGLQAAKQKNKERFTPKKFRKE